MLSPRVEEIGRDFYCDACVPPRSTAARWSATPTPIAWCTAKPTYCPPSSWIAMAITW